MESTLTISFNGIQTLHHDQERICSSSHLINSCEKVKSYLQKHDFANALEALKLLPKKTMTSNETLSLFLWQTKDNFEIANAVLESCKEFYIWKVCVNDFSEFLLEKKEIDLSDRLKRNYPEAFLSNNKSDEYWKTMNYAFTDRLDRAIKNAGSFPNDFKQQIVLNKIKAFCLNTGRQEDSQRIALIESILVQG
jgi:hypothetical protein